MNNATKWWSEEIKITNRLVSGPRKVTGREDKTIGIEIEFTRMKNDGTYVNIDAVKHALEQAGLNMYSRVIYHHTVMPQWKIVTDSSCGYELVSPPLAIREMERQLKIAMDTLQGMDIKIDRTCGLHVHHDINDLTISDVRNLYEIYLKHEETINSLMPESRRNDAYYTRSLSSQSLYYGGRNYTLIEFVRQANSISDLANELIRFSTLNAQAYLSYGTMEFRQHNGTLNYEKAINWVIITQAMIAAAQKMSKVRPLKADLSESRKVTQFTKDLGLWDTEQNAFIFDRRAEHKNRAAEREARREARRAEREARRAAQAAAETPQPMPVPQPATQADLPEWLEDI